MIGLPHITYTATYCNSPSLPPSFPPSLPPSLQAAHCNPPLEEGDQVLYINGKSVGDRTHDQVILMLRAGSGEELVLIVKPRDLSR